MLFGSGYVELSNWWKFGALASVINILIWAVVGGLWSCLELGEFSFCLFAVGKDALASAAARVPNLV
ncbi:MAG: anion permease [Verrucomicrobia bacterium]|nr:anion permease [Verrucomicrobiota bacterium]